MDTERRGGEIINYLTPEEMEYLKRVAPLKALSISERWADGRSVIVYPVETPGHYLQSKLEQVITGGGFEITGDLSLD